MENDHQGRVLGVVTRSQNLETEMLSPSLNYTKKEGDLSESEKGAII